MTTGFTDIHCHGGGGYSFSDSNPEHIQIAIDTHKAHGTTTQIASLVTEPLDALKKQIKNLIPFVESGALAGIHLEGPYLSHAKCGAHDPALLRNPKLDEIKELLEVGAGHIKMLTIAPELPGALETISYLRNNNITAAIGHSDATFDEAVAGIKAGATVVTHMFNGLPALDHREATITNALLVDPDMYFEIILDGTHVNRSAMDLMLTLAADRIILVTDAMSAAGGKDARYKIGDLDVNVAGGVATLVSNGSLAGSTLTMDSAHDRLVREHGVSEAITRSATMELGKKALRI